MLRISRGRIRQVHHGRKFVGRNLGEDLGVAVVTEELVGGVVAPNADDDLFGVALEIEEDKVTPEENIADEEAGEAWWGGLHARLVRVREVPNVVWDLELAAGDVEEEGLVRRRLVDIADGILPGRKGRLCELAVEVRVGHDEARGARVHDGGDVLGALAGGVLEFNKLLVAVAERHGHDRVIMRGDARSHEHVSLNRGGIVAA